jgi:hypothetical protein
MKHISNLADIGAGKRCLIVGGGHSINRFQWDKLEDTYVICCNNHLSQLADMIVYYDKDMRDHFNNHNLSDQTLLIGFKKTDGATLDHTSEKCTHYYNYQDMVFGDTGFHAVQFADRIFRFTQIYLIGFDYKVIEKSYHHDENESDPEKVKKFKLWSIDVVLKRYIDINWMHKIYNCSEESELKVFEYGLPY